MSRGFHLAPVLRRSVKSILRRFGYDIVKYSPANFARLRRLELMRDGRVTVVLDVGANMGQFGSEIRDDGYRGRIVSFEPLRSAFELLKARADDQWECFSTALGAEDGEAILHVSENTWSSSLLPVTPRHVAAAPSAATVADTSVSVRALDSLRDEILQPDDRAFLKIDAQGYEGEVLAGAGGVLSQVVGLELELSLVPLYDEQPRVSQLLGAVDRLGFALVDVRHGFVDPVSGELLQIDALFARQQAS